MGTNIYSRGACPLPGGLLLDNYHSLFIFVRCHQYCDAGLHRVQLLMAVGCGESASICKLYPLFESYDGE